MPSSESCRKQVVFSGRLPEGLVRTGIHITTNADTLLVEWQVSHLHSARESLETNYVVATKED